MSLKKLPIGIQSFEKVRTDGFRYIDKTHLVYNLAKSGCYYFLSRPRRFGKSLFLSTLEAYFLGKKELFEGLYVEELEKDWIEYPVLHLDLNTQKYENASALNNVLNEMLDKWEQLYGKNTSEVGFGRRFQGVIQRAYEKTGRRVVILVDEYDKPVLQAIGNDTLQDEYRSTLKGFYGALKSCDQYIQFAFLTGVTKFGKISIFSDLNHLNDISMDPRYYDICGLTEKEIKTNLSEEVEALAENLGVQPEEAYTMLKEYYDGYHFSEDKVPGLYNPFSILNALDKKKIESYWFETGTPTYLVELLKKHNYNLSYLEKEVLSSDALNSIDSTSSDPVPVIYQSGYLTITGYDKEFSLYKLGYPNKEVEEGFVKFLIPYYTNVEKTRSGFEISQFVLCIRNKDIEGFMNHLQAFLSACPYELQPDQERHFQSVMYILTTLCGFYAEVEEHTSKGRMDMTIKTDKYIYIFEFKFNSTASIALKRISDMGYADKFKNDKREIICIGVNYSSEERNIDQWLIKSGI
ncbi:MAG: AAA family ATPase [Candidatus Cryptobacteroides sp.]